jgi:hypothetical protein
MKQPVADCGAELKKAHAGVEVLYTTAALRGAIRDVLAGPQPGDRRVALVAYVGGEAQDFLPDPDGLELVCSLQPGATDSLTLGRLKNRGAILFQSRKLHMKVYWSSRKGCVVCSANASGNALGGGGLIEAGIRLPPGAVDVGRLWAAAKPVSVGGDDLKALADKTPARKPLGSRGSGAKAPSFLEWTETEGVQSWKLGWWDVRGGAVSTAAKEKARRTYDIRDPHDSLPIAKGQAGSNDWFLAFDVRAPAKAKWFNADFVIKVPKEDKKAYEADYPYQAVMLRTLQKYEAPPFKLDRSFGRAFGLAVSEFGPDRFEELEDLTPTPDFIALIKKALASATSRYR